ncbi:MAG: 2,3,4,5-tetrahydropyridine-2,6-dicarboxylate N-succinyltransferase [Holosporales bacterium]|jgi:2,3,4,5-tetrahydropyridine-2-carboxylate N-succinyltransferase|nr:2,3,4,5-tetrahydropyridine-2,6-dicarboxylate N-succinyltransferase [Holosporales bacterium]
MITKINNTANDMPFIELIHQLDAGTRRVCSAVNGQWIVDEELKRAILEYISSAKCVVQHGVYDKVPLKFDRWQEADFHTAKLRIVPGAVVRYGAFLAPNVVLMNCFVNIGAYIDERTMIDSFATIGSCAQVGANCHVAAGAVIGGVLEPVTARPVIIEDNCFIGAHASVVEGVIVRRGATLAMGVHIGASTKIVDRQSGKVFYQEVPEHAIVVPGAYDGGATAQGRSPEGPNVHLQCAVIVRYGETKQHTKINDALRDEDRAPD